MGNPYVYDAQYASTSWLGLLIMASLGVACKSGIKVGFQFFIFFYIFIRVCDYILDYFGSIGGVIRIAVCVIMFIGLIKEAINRGP